MSAIFVVDVDQCCFGLTSSECGVEGLVIKHIRIVTNLQGQMSYWVKDVVVISPFQLRDPFFFVRVCCFSMAEVKEIKVWRCFFAHINCLLMEG